MAEIAAMFRLPGPESRAHFGDRRRPARLRAMPDMERGRTERLGGQVYPGEPCRAPPYRYHSWKNRHGPKGQHDQAPQWLEQQERLLWPGPHCTVTCTLPHALRALARRHQPVFSHSLFRSSSQAPQALARDPRCIGGSIGMAGVLHTWTRDRRSHPHAHSIVPGGGRTADGRWLPPRQDFRVPVTPLSALFRAKCRDARHKTALCPRIDAQVWPKDWVVHWEPVGHGAEACRDLAPDSFRVAIRNNRILTWPAGSVTLPDTEAAAAEVTSGPLPAGECMRRFRQPVLPARCITVRDDGLLRPTTRHVLNPARALLDPGTVEADSTGHHRDRREPTEAPSMPRCPTCGRPVILGQTLRPTGRSPP
jgi:hypothetical protein